MRFAGADMGTGLRPRRSRAVRRSCISGTVQSPTRAPSPGRLDATGREVGYPELDARVTERVLGVRSVDVRSVDVRSARGATYAAATSEASHRSGRRLHTE